MIYAIIEAADEGEQGVYRSTDFGQNWSQRSDHMTVSPQYYNELVIDPNDANVVYALDTFTHRSEDGGVTFTRFSHENRHVDDHALWIDPNNSKHLIIGGDGGVYESWDGGELWRHHENLPITQFYRVQPDNASPFYNVCGGTQDNYSLCGPSRTPVIHGITNADWIVILGGDGYEPQIDPEDPNIIYTQYQYGGLARYDRRTQERLYIAPQPASGETDYRWNWNTPLLISPHNRERLYYAAERVFRSDDRGNSWTAISDDLSRGLDRNALPLMDRVWSVDTVAKNDSTSFYGSAIALTESTLVEGLIYVGTDDGVISVTEDGGATWRSSTDLGPAPEQTLVEDMIASLHDADRVYAVFDNHKRGDDAPYVVRSDDRGRTWRSIAGDLPGRGPAHTIAEDHVDPDLLFVGTEFGLYFTQNGGESWTKLSTNFPTIDVRDVEIQRRENDLVVGTFGRGIYILDDYAPLRTPSSTLEEAEATLFAVKDTWLYIQGDLWGGTGGPQGYHGDSFFYADNPPYGAVFTYFLRDGLQTAAEERRAADLALEEAGEDTPYPSWDSLRAEDREDAPAMVLTVRDGAGAVVRRIVGPASQGLHRVAWDMRLERPDAVDLNDSPPAYGEAVLAPLALPGSYTVELAIRRSGALTPIGEPQSFSLIPMGRSPGEAASDRDALLAFQMRTSEVLSRVAGANATASDVGDRVAHLKIAIERTPRADDADRVTLAALESRLDDVLVALRGDRTLQQRNEPAPVGLASRVSRISWSSWNSQAAPAGVHQESLAVAETELADVTARLSVLVSDLTAFEAALGEKGAPWTPGRSLEP